LETAPARPKSQEKSSRSTNRISLSDAAKISSHNEGKLRRLVKSGQLRARIILAVPRPKRPQGREVQIWVDPADVLALEPPKAKVRSAALKVKGGSDATRN